MHYRVDWEGNVLSSRHTWGSKTFIEMPHGQVIEIDYEIDPNEWKNHIVKGGVPATPELLKEIFSNNKEVFTFTNFKGFLKQDVNWEI
jgi:hypothetical protein